MPSYLFSQPDMQLYHLLEIKLRDTLNTAVAINATIEKCLKRGLWRNTKIFQLASYGRWL